MKELQLRVRGLNEEENEDIREIVVTILAELLEKSPELIDANLDQIYRLRLRFAEKEGVPRDVIVNTTTKKLKEEILRQCYENPIEYKGRKVIIMKELPRQVILQRKKFKKLIEVLKKKKIRFRWELPEGVTFIFKDKRTTIRLEEDLEKFVKENEKFLEDEM